MNKPFKLVRHILPRQTHPEGIYLLKVNNGNIRTTCKICSKLTIKTPERLRCRGSGIFFLNLEKISHIALAFLLLTLNK